MAKKTKEITGDEETDAILSEMEQEGEELPAFADAPEDDEDAEESEDSETEEEDEDADEEEEESEDESDEDETEEEADDDESEEGDEEEQGEEDDDSEDSDDEDEEEKVPLWKRHKALKKKFKDAEQLIDDLKKNTTENDLDAQVDAFSKKHKVSKDAAKDLIELAASLAAKKAGIDPELKATIDSVMKRDRETKFWDKQNQEYARDFKSNVAPLAKRDGLDPAKIQKRLQELSFFPENAKKSLVTLYLEKYSKADGPKRKITSEGNRTHGRVSSRNTEDIQPEDIEDMSDEEFDAYSDGLAKASKFKITRH